MSLFHKTPMTSKKFDRRLKRFFLPTKREFRSKRLQIKTNGLGCEWVGISGMGLAFVMTSGHVNTHLLIKRFIDIAEVMRSKLQKTL